MTGAGGSGILAYFIVKMPSGSLLTILLSSSRNENSRGGRSAQLVTANVGLNLGYLMPVLPASHCPILQPEPLGSVGSSPPPSSSSPPPPF